jgi:hypothetical protein
MLLPLPYKCRPDLRHLQHCYWNTTPPHPVPVSFYDYGLHPVSELEIQEGTRNWLYFNGCERVEFIQRGDQFPFVSVEGNGWISLDGVMVSSGLIVRITRGANNGGMRWVAAAIERDAATGDRIIKDPVTVIVPN